MRYTCSLPALLTLCVVALLSVATTLQAAEGPKTTELAPPERTVIFAPVGLGPFAEIDASADKRLPREMVDYLKRQKVKFEARVAETLPNGGDEIWSKEGTAKRMASGAHYAIVGTIDSIESVKDIRHGKNKRNRSIVAKMTIRAINPVKGEVWVKTFKGSIQEKFSQNVSESLGQHKQAVQKAATKCMNALQKWLNSNYDEEKKSFIGGEMTVIEAAPLLDIKFTSIPEGAKIYVDEVFRGKTPTVVPLTARKWTIKIERQGYKPWVQEVDISPEMVIQPALVPIEKE